MNEDVAYALNTERGCKKEFPVEKHESYTGFEED